MASAAKKVVAPGFIAQMKDSLRKFKFYGSDHYKYGMLYNDVFIETDEVKEAIRRLPQEVKDERTYRIIRAVQCSIRHEYLPKEQWTKFEEDIHYLQPYIDEVVKENKEKHDWEKQ